MRNIDDGETISFTIFPNNETEENNRKVKLTGTVNKGQVEATWKIKQK